ncbi:MAG: imidazole glycerol phosphate synthase subunit HisH [Acidobacteriota bacterium]
MVWIVDAGTGNLRSLANALKAVGLRAEVRRTPGPGAPGAVVLPGVGAFGHASRNLEEAGWKDFLLRWAEAGKPLLGICLGMQLLFEASEESPGATGLGLMAGSVRLLGAGAPRLPHTGWALLRGAAPGTPEAQVGWAYFVHSYVVEPREASVVAATAQYGEEFPAVVRAGSVTGVQFHPEKSQRDGLRLLAAWAGEVRP